MTNTVLFIKEFVKDISEIKAVIQNKKLVVFAGAGISVDSGIPKWKEFINRLQQDIDISDEMDFLKIAQMY